MKLLITVCVQTLALFPMVPAGGTVADSGGVRGVQMHPPLAASNVFLRT